MSDSHVETQAAPRRRRSLFRRDESGLTTLEWLLIVAAVAGLAALAVVLVQNVVDDTAEQIGGSSARLTAAKVAAADINDRAIAATAPTSQTEWDALALKYERECDRLEITYGDAGITPTWDITRATSGWAAAWPTNVAASGKGCTVA